MMMHVSFRKTAFVWAAVAVCCLLTAPAGAASVFDDAVAYWAFEGTGDTIIDSKGGQANMTIADATSPNRITGLVGGAIQVNHGDQQYATTGGDVNKLDFDSRDDFSVAGWVMQYEGSPVFLKMANTVGDGYRGWHLETKDTAEIDFLLRHTNATTDKIGVYGWGRIPFGEWVHVAATYHYDENDPTRGVRIYVNGTLFDSYTTATGLATPMDTTSDKPFQFTARETREYLDYYDTSYDEVGVWNRVLSQAEVQQLVNAAVPDVPMPVGANYIENGDFEDTTGWVPPGTDVLPPAGWASYSWKTNPAAQATVAAAVGGTGTSALMEEARLSGINRRGMAQSFVHATDPKWQFDMDFATEAPSTNTQRALAMTLRTENGAQLSFIVSDPDDNGLGDLQIGFGEYTTIPGLENKIVFDNDLSDLTGSVHHLTVVGHFDDATPNYDVFLTDPSDNVYSALGVTMCSGDMAPLVTGMGLSQVGFYTYSSYGDWVIDNVSVVNVPEPSSIVMLLGAMMWLAGFARKQ